VEPFAYQNAGRGLFAALFPMIKKENYYNKDKGERIWLQKVDSGI
jgi:hypothetical protein